MQILPEPKSLSHLMGSASCSISSTTSLLSATVPVQYLPDHISYLPDLTHDRILQSLWASLWPTAHDHTKTQACIIFCASSSPILRKGKEGKGGRKRVAGGSLCKSRQLFGTLPRSCYRSWNRGKQTKCRFKPEKNGIL